MCEHIGEYLEEVVLSHELNPTRLCSVPLLSQCREDGLSSIPETRTDGSGTHTLTALSGSVCPETGGQTPRLQSGPPGTDDGLPEVDEGSHPSRVWQMYTTREF